MNRKVDQQSMEQLLYVLEEMKADLDERRAKRESKLFSPISIPYQLRDSLQRCTKEQLDKIRKKRELKGLSSLKKQALIQALVEQIPNKVFTVFSYVDEERYLIAKKICTNGGYIALENLPLAKVNYFLEHGVIFPGLYEGRKVLSMPRDIMAIFQDMDHEHLSKLAKRNSEWIKLTHGLLYYYGVLPSDKLKEMVAKLTSQSIDTMAFIYVLYDAMDYYGQITYDHRLRLCDQRVFDSDSVIEEQNKRQDVDYYPFKKKELLRAGEAGYMEKSPAVNRFIHFLYEHYEMTIIEAENIVEECTNLILLDMGSQHLLEFLNTRVEFPSMERVNQIMELCNHLYNNTRMWILKGYTPEELFQREKKLLKHLPTSPLSTPQKGAQVIDLQSRRKTGRNEPCPCGSGIKYKHCCGK